MNLKFQEPDSSKNEGAHENLIGEHVPRSTCSFYNRPQNRDRDHETRNPDALDNGKTLFANITNKGLLFLREVPLHCEQHKGTFFNSVKFSSTKVTITTVSCLSKAVVPV